MAKAPDDRATEAREAALHAFFEQHRLDQGLQALLRAAVGGARHAGLEKALGAERGSLATLETRFRGETVLDAFEVACKLLPTHRRHGRGRRE